MKNIIFIPLIAFACTGLSALMGQSNDAGLFGAIIAVGLYAARRKGGAA